MAERSDITPEQEESVLPLADKLAEPATCEATEEETSSNWEVVGDDEDDEFENAVENNQEDDVRDVGNCVEEGAVGGSMSEDYVTNKLDNVNASSTSLNVTGMDRLLQRHRNEIMFELRRLKFGDRPVTGREDRRQAVEALVSRCVAQPSPRQSRSRLDSMSARGPAPSRTEPQRPEEVMIEVNALVERRPVSSILQSETFRRSIETSLRGVLGSIQRDLRSRLTPTFNESQTQSPGSTRVQRTYSGAADSTSSAVAATAVAAAAEHSAENLNISNSASIENLAQGGPVESHREVSAEPRHARDRNPRVTDSNSTRGPVLGDQPPVGGAQRAREWLRDNVPTVDNNGFQTEMAQFQFMHEVQRENLIVDISELIQRHLVTSALEGEFRHVLERRMRNRLDQTGIDGTRVQEQLRQLPRGRPYGRNDFMDLGINAGPGAQGGAGSDPLDDVSVISATAAVALPQAYTQSTAAMGRDIQGLKNQMKELKRMMQLSFDLQLDIQRAIRQEVAAAVSATLGSANSEASGVSTTGGPTVSETLRRSRRPTPGSDTQCVICLDKPVDTVMYQCGHMCLCYGCGMQLKQQGAHCPVCRAPIRDIIKTYKN